MTYLARTHRRYVRPRSRKAGLSGFLDDLANQSGNQQTSACLDQANAAVAPFDAQIDALTKTWNPTGFYRPQDLRDMVGAAMKLVGSAQSAVDQAAAEPNASQDSIMRATDDLARAGSRAIDYLQAAATADAQGVTAINAVGVKRWVTDTMASASSALVTASVIGCLRPWWVDALANYQVAFDIAWAVVKRVGGVVLAVGETALKIADDLPQLYDILKWVALVGGGYWLWIQLSNHHKSGHSFL